MIKRRTERSGPVLPDVLPPLRGRSLRIYNLVWAAALLLALAITGIGAWRGIAPGDYDWLNYGFTIDADGWRIATVTGAEARAEGVATGDSIVAINGVAIDRIESRPAALQSALARPERETVTLALRDSSGRIITRRLTRNAANTAEWEVLRRADAGVAVLMQLALLAAAVVLFRRKREPAPAIFALSFMLLAASVSQDAWLWLDQPLLHELLLAVGFSLTLVGLLVFPDGRLASRASWLIVAAIVIWSVSLFALPWDSGGTAFVLGLALLLPAVGARQVLRYRRMPRGSERQQVRWAVLGFVSGVFFLVISTALDLATPLGGSMLFFRLSAASSAASLLAILFIVGGLLVSLMRYRLYDADAVIGRSAAYGVLTLGFVALFAGGENVIQALGGAYLGGQTGALASGLAAAAAAVLIAPLHGRVDQWAERRFQKNLIRLREGLPKLVSDLRETAPVDRIASVAMDAVIGGVRASRAAMVVEGAVVAARDVPDETVYDWISRWDTDAEGRGAARSDPLFPMRLPLEAEATGRIGWLLLGPRPDGSFYGKDEREALTEIAEPVARAIEIARTRERRECEMLAMLERLETRIQALEGGGGRGDPPAWAVTG